MTHDVAPPGPLSSSTAAGAGSTPAAGPGAATWRTAAGPLDLVTPRIMGILNITPDSFHAGGRLLGRDDALEHVAALLAEGADILDIGGESTRPGAEPVGESEEIDRVLPVIEAVRRQWPDAILSVDTVKAGVARAALAAGVAIINDVSGLRLDPAMAEVCAAAGAGVVLMHSRGGVDRMASYETATYEGDPVEAVIAELRAAQGGAREAGIREDAIVLDPGLGFSKRTEHSVAMLRALPRLRALGRPVLVGPSRKRFIGELAGGLPVADRLPGTIAACVAALFGGARIFRVHDVAPVRHALAVAEAVAP